MNTTYEHLYKTDKQLLSWFKAKSKEGKNAFLNFEEFKSWYNDNEKICHYCGLTETQSQEIAISGKLKSKRFPQNGKHGRGTSRAMWLEIDRYDPGEKYKIGNIVFACYFCNNDKSDIFHGDEYKLFMQNRLSFLKRLIIVFLVLFFCSCQTLDRDVVSENQAKEMIQKKVSEESNGLVELLDFKKMDGVKQEMFGQKGYLMSYHLKLRCKQNVHQYFLNDKSFNFYSDEGLRKKLSLGNMMSKGDFENYKKGEIIEYDYKNLFKKTENGWNY